jgi:hypothetical protein
MASTQKYVERLADWVGSAVRRQLKTRVDPTTKNLLPMPQDASAWLKAGPGGGVAPVWLRDMMVEGVKTQLVIAWKETPDQVGLVSGDSKWTPVKPKPNTDMSPEGDIYAFEEWVSYALTMRLLNNVLDDGHDKLLTLPEDVQEWLDTSDSAKAPLTVMEWVADAADELNWDDGNP